MSRRGSRLDPVRAHGAWIFLFAAVAAGGLAGGRGPVEPALLVATAFVGAFLATAQLSSAPSRGRRRTVTGALLALGAPWPALALGASPSALVPAACALVAAGGTVVAARVRGALAPATLLLGVAALTLAAPTTAMARGATPGRAALLFGLLFAVFAWRTLRVAARLDHDAAWDRAALRATGLREAGLSALWTLLVVVALPLVAD